MNKLSLAVSLAGLAVLAPHARAAPCSATTSRIAASILDRDPGYVTYCPTCGDAAPSTPRRAAAVSLVDRADSLELDGRVRELQDVYVQTSPARYENLAALAGCPVAEVVPSLDVSGATATGVLIVPSDVPVTPLAPLAPPAPLAPALATVAPPAPLVVAPPALIIVPVDASSPWGWIAGYIGLGLGAAGALVLVAARRRRRHTADLPRALGLVASRDRLDRW